MSTLSAQRMPFFIVMLSVIAMTIAGFALVLQSILPPQALLYYWLLVGGVVFFVYYCVRGDLLSLVLIWFVTLICLHEELWRIPMPPFFSLTIPRIGIVVLAAVFILMGALGRLRLRRAWPISAFIVLLLAYFAISAFLSGFETRSVVTVHYKLIGGYVFPFTAFALILHAFRTERDFKRLTIFFAVVGLYLTFTGWCEEFDLSPLIWPRFIDDPNVGIHWGRVRGPFVMSAAMGLALVFCYFNNLVLARNLHRGAWLLYVLNVLMLPAIFWTKTRSVWLSLVVCSLIWAAYSRRKTTRVVSVCVLLSAALLIAAINMDNFVTSDRDKGGVTDTEPLLMRVGLAQMTWHIVQDHPLFGLGFGHFRDYAPSYARDPSSPYFAFGSSAMEHNNLLSIVAETGLVGLCLYLLLILAVLRASIRLFHKLPPSARGFIGRDLLVLYWILAAAYFIDGTFRETSDNPFANSLFYGLSAIPVALDFLLSPAPIRARPCFPAVPSTGVRRRRPDGRLPHERVRPAMRARAGRSTPGRSDPAGGLM